MLLDASYESAAVKPSPCTPSDARASTGPASKSALPETKKSPTLTLPSMCAVAPTDGSRASTSTSSSTSDTPEREPPPTPGTPST